MNTSPARNASAGTIHSRGRFQASHSPIGTAQETEVESAV
jgi:hypothetical protein